VADSDIWDLGGAVPLLTRPAKVVMAGRRTVLAAGCCRTTVTWPGPDESGACECGALTWRAVGEERIEFAGPAACMPICIWEER
jgi:hypothetical protein